MAVPLVLACPMSDMAHSRTCATLPGMEPSSAWRIVWIESMTAMVGARWTSNVSHTGRHWTSNVWWSCWAYRADSNVSPWDW